MAERLGDVLYWMGCISFAALVVVGAAIAISGTRDEVPVILAFFVVSGGIVWVIGRACRYVLAGR